MPSVSHGGSRATTDAPGDEAPEGPGRRPGPDRQMEDGENDGTTMRTLWEYMGVSIVMGGTPKLDGWLMYKAKSPLEMDDNYRSSLF